jgi:hypothetical protein
VQAKGKPNVDTSCEAAEAVAETVIDNKATSAKAFNFYNHLRVNIIKI